MYVSILEIITMFRMKPSYLKENATVFPYSNMFFPQLRQVDM